MKTRIVQATLFAYLLFCIYLVTFAGINFKELQYENWVISTNYMVGMAVCIPAGLMLSILPDQWLTALGSRTVDLLLAFLSAALCFIVLFHSAIRKAINAWGQK